MDVNLYRRLVNDLKESDIEYYLSKDPLVVKKITEIIIYTTKYRVLPAKKALFKCEKREVNEWIKEVINFDEPLFQDLKAYVSQFKIKAYGKGTWMIKFQDLYDYIKANKKMPAVFEQSLFDGSDMYKWYRTQIQILNNPNKDCKPLDEEQKECLKKIDELIQEINRNSNIDRLKELYFILLENENLHNLRKLHFSDGLVVDNFYKKVINKEIILAEKEQKLFNKICRLAIRLNKDGKVGDIKYIGHNAKNVQYEVKKCLVKEADFSGKVSLGKEGFVLNELSYGSCINYLRILLDLTIDEMANLLGVTSCTYKQIEANRCKFSYFRKMQFIGLAKRENIQDEFLEKLLIKLESLLNYENYNRLTYYLVKLSSLFSLKNALGREKAFKFCEKYRVERCSGINRKYSTDKKLEIYKELKEIREVEYLLDDEILIVEELNTILKKEILEDFSDRELINKVNISLGLKCLNSSIYSISLDDAKELLEKYEMIKINNDLNQKQLAYINKCIELLLCVLNPGRSLSFEVLRIKDLLSFSYEELGNLLGIDHNVLWKLISCEEVDKKKSVIINSLDKFDQFGNSIDIERFKDCFLETQRLFLNQKWL